MAILHTLTLFFITISRTPSKLQNMGVWALLYSDVSRCVLSWLCYSNTGMVQEKWGQLFILHSFMKKKCIRIQICHNFTKILKNISIWKTEAPVKQFMHKCCVRTESLEFHTKVHRYSDLGLWFHPSQLFIQTKWLLKEATSSNRSITNGSICNTS